MTSMKQWAENEIKIACKRENPDWDGKSFDYGCSCYQSAFKAYKSIMEDEHSGMSFAFTRNILIRLLNQLPITPIKDTPDVWSECTWEDVDGSKHYQCLRMYGLFKKVDKDGNVTYSDNDRYSSCDIGTDDWYKGSGIGKLIDELYPIKMPYYPSVNKFKVYTDTFIAEGFEGDDTDYNTRAILYLITPDGEKVEINRYYADTDNGLVEITEERYKDRLSHRKVKENE